MEFITYASQNHLRCARVCIKLKTIRIAKITNFQNWQNSIALKILEQQSSFNNQVLKNNILQINIGSL